MKKYDLLIVGAGPGGCAAALELRNSSADILLLEKGSFPRDKICGDALSGKVLNALRLLKADYKDALYGFEEKLDTWGIRFYAPNRKALDIPFYSSKSTESMAPGFISKRIDFDQFLFELVKKETNIEIKENFQLKEVEKKGDYHIITDGKERIATKLIIGADGAHSRVAKYLSDIRVEKKHHSAGIRAYYEGVTGFNEENFIELHYLKDLLPGYFWVFPLAEGKANVGLGMLSEHVGKHKINLKESLKDIIHHDPFLSERFKSAKLIGDIKGFGLPLGSKRRKISGERFLLVGDAAALIDPFTGEGISNAMISGMLAARWSEKALTENKFSADFFQDYDKEVYHKLGKELDLSYKMQKLVRFPWLFNFIVNKANRNPSLRAMFTMMFENLDIRKELSKPSFYWDLILK
ncbi:MAG: geranylgeranyl reductase family protein [Bacteroidota bacterium]